MTTKKRLWNKNDNNGRIIMKLLFWYDVLYYLHGHVFVGKNKFKEEIMKILGKSIRNCRQKKNETYSVQIEENSFHYTVYNFVKHILFSSLSESNSSVWYKIQWRSCIEKTRTRVHIRIHHYGLLLIAYELLTNIP